MFLLYSYGKLQKLDNNFRNILSILNNCFRYFLQLVLIDIILLKTYFSAFDRMQAHNVHVQHINSREITQEPAINSRINSFTTHATSNKTSLRISSNTNSTLSLSAFDFSSRPSLPWLHRRPALNRRKLSHACPRVLLLSSLQQQHTTGANGRRGNMRSLRGIIIIIIVIIIISVDTAGRRQRCYIENGLRIKDAAPRPQLYRARRLPYAYTMLLPGAARRRKSESLQRAARIYDMNSFKARDAPTDGLTPFPGRAAFAEAG